MIFILMRIFFLAIAVLNAVPFAMLLVTPGVDSIYARPAPEHDRVMGWYTLFFWALSAFLWWFDIVRHQGTSASNKAFAWMLALGLIWISVIYGVKYYSDVMAMNSPHQHKDISWRDE